MRRTARSGRRRSSAAPVILPPQPVAAPGVPAPAGSPRRPLTRGQIIQAYGGQAKTPSVPAVVEGGTAVAQVARRDQDYRAHLAAVSVAFPLLTLPPAFALAVPLGTGLVAVGLVPLMRDGWRQVRLKRMVGIDAANASFYAALIFLGFAPYAAFGLGTYYISRIVLTRTRRRAREKLTPLAEVEARLKPVRRHPSGEMVMFETLRAGDMIELHAGDIVPVDGRVVDGEATVDEHQLTGEMLGSEKLPGSTVLAMTVVNRGRLVVSVEKGWHESSAARLMDILYRTTDTRPEMQIKADRYADRAAPVAIAAGMAAVPLGGPMLGLALYNSLPGKQCRLVSPFAMLTTLREAARLGVLVKDGRVLEVIGDIKIFAFDKSGTLTDSVMEIGAIETRGLVSAEAALGLAAAVQGQSDHPIALALRAAASTRGVSLPVFESIAQAPGLGMRGVHAGAQVRVGSLRYLCREGIAVSDDLAAAGKAVEAAGATCVFLAVADTAVAVFELRPRLREGAATVVQHLRQMGYHVAVISGDAESPTRHLAERLGVDSWHAGILPHEKAQVVEAWQSQGKGVCFVGDGVNDGAALRCARMSVSLEGATTLAVDEAQVVLMRHDLTALLDFLTLVRGFAVRARVAFACSTAVELAGATAVVATGATVATTAVLNSVAVWAGLLGFHAVPAGRRHGGWERISTKVSKGRPSFL